MDIPFDATYPGANTWAQRIATELRVPRPDGVQFVTDAQGPESNHMLKSILLRPLHMPDKDKDSWKIRELDAFAELCTPSNTEETWPALHGGPGKPGPFQRGFAQFLEQCMPLYESAT